METLSYIPTRLPRRAIMAACCLGMSTISFAVTGPAVFLTALAGDLRLTLPEQGVFLATTSWGLTIAILLVGPLPDRLGFRAIMATGAAIQAAGLLLISQASSVYTAYAGGFLVGMGCGVADALLTPIVCAIYPERRVRMSGLLHSFYAIGLVVTVLILLAVIEAGWAWRSAFLLLAAMVVPYGLLALVLPLPAQAHEGSQRMPARHVIRLRAFWLLLGAILLSGVTELGPGNWLPTFVQKAAAGSRSAGALGLLAFGVTMAVGRLAVSATIHRLGVRRLFVIGGALCAGSLGLASLPWGPEWSAAWLALLGLGVAGFWPTIIATAGDRFPRAGASMFSLLSATGNLGGVVGPIAIGLVADRTSLFVAMRMMAAAPVLVLALIWLAVPRGQAVGQQGA